MRDVYKSALWALISIPISLIGVFLSRGLVHTGGIWLFPFYPAFIAIALLGGPKESPKWLLVVVALIAQYLGYFLLIYFIRKLMQTRVENITKEQSEKNQIT